MYKLAPSILNADYGNLESQIKLADRAGADMIHLDVMDGMFVPCISFGWDLIKDVRHCTDKKFDVHLMIDNPDRYLHYFKEAGADIISVHAEACSQLDVTIERIRDLGCKVGVVLNPATSLTALDFVLEKIDMVLLMTVNPGFGGQKYMTSMTRKILELRKTIDEREVDVEIEVDGGITIENVRTVMDAGADIIVSGSGIYRGDVTQNVKNFLEIFKEYGRKDV